MKSSLLLSLVILISSAAPSFAQMVNVASDEQFGAQKSKIADVDILTDSPTMRINGGGTAHLGAQYNFQSQAQTTVPMQQTVGYGDVNPNLGIQQNEAVNSIAQQMSGNVQQGQLQMQQQGAQGLIPGVQGQIQPQGAQAQVAQKAAIDGQAVGRMVGVAGTAIMLGAFMKSGGLGGMMNSFGFDNRYRGRASGW